MVTNPHIVDHEKFEKQLNEILSLLNPPQQDYETLAVEAWHFLNPPSDERSKLPAEPSVVQVLATYFELFATGYAHWQQSYDYPRIHEYFYGAYLQAKEIGGDRFSEEKQMLEELTKAMIAYTNCENAQINNDSKELLQAAEKATGYGKGALARLPKAIPESNKEHTIGYTIKQYLEMNIRLWEGLAICAQGYLDAQQGKAFSDSDQRKIEEELLPFLEGKSQELFSELNAHYSFVQRHCEFRRKPPTSSLRIKQGRLFLRAIGYIGEKEVKALFDTFNKKESNRATQHELSSQLVQKKTKLPITTVRSSILMDIFDTVLGEKYLEQIVFDLSTDESELTFKLHMGSEEIPYQAEAFRISIARFGAISVEFVFPLPQSTDKDKNISVSHVRTLESLIGPHAGRFNFVWKWKETEEIDKEANKKIREDFNNSCVKEKKTEEIDEDFTNFSCTDFVEYFLHCKEWIKNPPDEIQSILNDWEGDLCKLAKYLKRQSANVEGEEDGPEDVNPKEKHHNIYLDLQKNFQGMRKHLITQSYLNNSTVAEDPNLKQHYASGKEIFAEGRTFGRLIDIVDLIIERMQQFLKELPEVEPTLSHGELMDSDAPIINRIQNFLIQEVVSVEKQLRDITESSINCMQRFLKPLYRFPKKTQETNQGRVILYRPEFDCNTGWQSILFCNRLAIVEASGKELEPRTEAEYKQILKHAEFKGFAIQPREARAGIDDWVFVASPKIRNLATIRSHDNDVLYVGVNKAFLWFPDDPEFLFNQYIETIRIISDIKTLVLTFNTKAKEQIEFLEESLEGIDEKSKGDRDFRLKKYQQELSELRSGIEIFRTHAERILDILRACTISKFQDHSELLKKMLRECEAGDSQISLERNLENLGRIHGYLSGLLEQRIVERNQANQTLIASTVFILTFLSALAAIPALYQFIAYSEGGTTGQGILYQSMAGILLFVFCSGIAAGLIVWLRSRRI